jgi:hypothetical protein
MAKNWRVSFQGVTAMEKLESLVTKHTTSAQLEKWKNSSDTQSPLSPRQMAIAALINQTQARRGLPLITPGFELRSVLAAWESATKSIPDEYLTRAYERAAENWPWVDGKAFTPDAIMQAYTLLTVEDRQRAEADKRNAQRRSPDTYKCHHCADIGYQLVFIYRHKLWYSSQRPCCCETAPANERNERALSPPEWRRNSMGEFARYCDIEKYGPPNKTFKEEK